MKLESLRKALRTPKEAEADEEPLGFSSLRRFGTEEGRGTSPNLSKGSFESYRKAAEDAEKVARRGLLTEEEMESAVRREVESALDEPKDEDERVLEVLKARGKRSGASPKFDIDINRHTRMPKELAELKIRPPSEAVTHRDVEPDEGLARGISEDELEALFRTFAPERPAKSSKRPPRRAPALTPTEAARIYRELYGKGGKFEGKARK